MTEPKPENPETVPSAPKTYTASDVVHEWAQQSTMHGVAHAADRDNYHIGKRLVWLVLVVVALGLMTWQLGELVHEYLNYEVLTDTQTIVPPSLDLPEVTLCSSHMYQKSKMNQTGITDPTSIEELELISQPREEFILDSSFGFDFGLNLTEVWQPVITSFGRCWRFHYPKAEPVRQPGYLGGLHFSLFLNQDDFTNDSPLTGAFLFVEQPGSPIHEESKLPSWCLVISHWSICRIECLNALARKNCKCRHVGDNMDPEMRFCTDDDWFSCDEIFLANEDLPDCGCDLPPCHEWIYSTNHMSTSLSRDLLQSYEGYKPEQVKENVIIASINWEKLRYERLTESKAMSFAQLLGGLGGTMGLFVGISFLTVVEILGDLLFMRLIPRLFGNQGLYGLGSKH